MSRELAHRQGCLRLLCSFHGGKHNSGLHLAFKVPVLPQIVEQDVGAATLYMIEQWFGDE